MKQSNDEPYLPKLNEAVSLKDFLKQDGLQLMPIVKKPTRKTLKSVLKPNENITLLRS
jgi:16S rRNA (uracil1498-N3)-methyltransferase